MYSKILNNAMRSGLTLGLLFSINFALTVINSPLATLIFYAMIIFIVRKLIKSAKKFRDDENYGVLSYGQGFSLIFYNIFFATIISTLVKYIYLKFINQNYLVDMYEQQIEVFKQVLPSLLVNEEVTTMMKEMFTPKNYTIMFAWTNIICGLVLALILAAFVKRSVYQNRPEN